MRAFLAGCALLVLGTAVAEAQPYYGAPPPPPPPGYGYGYGGWHRPPPPPFDGWRRHCHWDYGYYGPRRICRWG